MAKTNLYNSSGMSVVPKLFNARGKWNTKSNLQKLEENIRFELMTSRGTQPGDPEKGSDIYKILFYGKTVATASRIRYEIERVLELKFPEVKIDKIDVEFLKNSVKIYLNYSIQYSNVNSNVTLEFISNEEG